VGRELRALRPGFGEWIFAGRELLDLTDHGAVEAFCGKRRFDAIINCAAYTAVDRAEEEPGRAEALNHLAVRNMAKIARKEGIRLLHLSTDYVFDGTRGRPYREDDPTRPLSVYGRTKLRGEEAIREIAPPGAIILRSSWLYGIHGHNFLRTMLRLGRERGELRVVADQIGTPTYARDLATTILKIIQNSTFKTQHSVEVFHYSNEGVASWYDFAKAIMEIAGIDCRVVPIPTEAYPAPAARPFYSVLDKRKIKEHLGIEIPHWRESLEGMLNGR
jgi:dTDP-4-dehydrorhamnose reductase